MRQPSMSISKTAAAVVFCAGAAAWMSSTSVASKVPDFEDASKRHAPVIAPAMPGELTLFGEPVPLDGFGVREALDRELVVNTYRHSSTILYFHILYIHRYLHIAPKTIIPKQYIGSSENPNPKILKGMNVI